MGTAGFIKHKFPFLGNLVSLSHLSLTNSAQTPKVA